jgi:hypothetical protein
MNINKKIKPNLTNPILKQKIIKTINPPINDYWKPTKNFIVHVYEDYIKPNFISIIILFIFLMILCYRYRLTQQKKIYQNYNVKTNDNININTNPNIQMSNSDIALLLYNYQKELSREPHVNGSVPRTKKNYSYPIYPMNSSHGRFDIIKSPNAK